MNKLALYFKIHGKYLFSLILFGSGPLFILWEFSPYPLPMVQYIVMGIIVLSQIAFFKERGFRRSLRSTTTIALSNELNRQPSNFEISKRLDFLVFSRNMTVIFSLISILFLMVYYNRFS